MSQPLAHSIYLQHSQKYIFQILCGFLALKLPSSLMGIPWLKPHANLWKYIPKCWNNVVFEHYPLKQVLGCDWRKTRIFKAMFCNTAYLAGVSKNVYLKMSFFFTTSALHYYTSRTKLFIDTALIFKLWIVVFFFQSALQGLR